MQHTVKELIQKIDAMRDRALVLQHIIETKEDLGDAKHHLDQIQSMALEIAADKEGNVF